MYSPIYTLYLYLLEAGTEGNVQVGTTRRTFTVALFLTISSNLRDSYTVKVKALANAFMYVHPALLMCLVAHYLFGTLQR